MNFSVSEENYIKGIYHLQAESGLVNTNALAIKLNTKAASVTDMLIKLKAKKLDGYLGTPAIDPHGDPIPDSHGKLPVIKQINLYGFPVKVSGIVSSVSNQSAQLLEMLKHYGIGIGSEIKVNKVFQFDGSLEIKVSKQAACIISEQVAKNIFVYHD
jgi:Fe2+ transport system protein FeoA